MKWRMWFWDGSTVEGASFDDAIRVADEHPDDVLVRMIYQEDGTREAQMGMRWYFVAPHPSGEYIYGTGMDRAQIEAQYEGAILQRGKWAPDNFYRRIVAEAMDREKSPPPCGCD